jgi:hypothetical protein
MVSVTALVLPILLSAVIVFVASSILHMVLPFHRSDYRQLPEEDKLLAALRSAGLQRGLYAFPFCTHKDMKSPAIQEKYKQGPVGLLTVFRVAGTAAFMTYSLGPLANGIWKGLPWSMVFKESFDGLIYSLLTAGTFGWLWPR